MKSYIKFKNVQIDYTANTTHETSIIKLKLQGDNNLFLIAAYATSSSKKKFTAELNQFSKTLEIHKNNYILLSGRRF